MTCSFAYQAADGVNSLLDRRRPCAHRIASERSRGGAEQARVGRSISGEGQTAAGSGDTEALPRRWPREASEKLPARWQTSFVRSSRFEQKLSQNIPIRYWIYL